MNTVKVESLAVEILNVSSNEQNREKKSERLWMESIPKIE